MYSSRLLGPLLTQLTLASVENLTYWCDMEMMSSKVALAGVPSIALYRESMSTVQNLISLLHLLSSMLKVTRILTVPFTPIL